jgi:hypothetical protein
VTAGEPIFVVGAPRSGTTMLRYMLCGHSRIYIPPESNFIPRFFARRPDERLDRRKAVEVIRAIEGYRVFFKDWRGALPDPAVLADEIPTLTPAGILHEIYGRYASQHGAVRWGDKSPMYACHIDTLAEIFPGAQFVHIIRDGRDVAQSMLRAYTTRRFMYVDICYATRTWTRSVRTARASGERLGPARYTEVRYEQLVRDPRATLVEICAFLGEEFEPAMAHPDEIARSSYHSKGIHAATREPVSAARVGGWRTTMAARDIVLFHAAAGDLVAELGYDVPDAGPMRWPDRARYARLRTKHALMRAASGTLRATGMFHPTDLLSRHLKLRPYSKRASPEPADAPAPYADTSGDAARVRAAGTE